LSWSYIWQLKNNSAYNKDKNELLINVINRNKDTSINTDIISQYGNFEGKATIYEVNGKDIKDQNSPEKQLVKTISKEVNVKGDKLNYSFPAHSFTMIITSVKSN
jgi:alpha-L-arabinofuranosidase